MTQTFHLISPLVRANAVQAVSSAEPGMIVTVRKPTRSSGQNDKFHAMCEDIARSGLEWAGKPRNAADWKALLVSAHSIATGSGGEVIPGIEGEFVAIRESTSRMRVGRASSLIEYVSAFCANNEIQLKETISGGFGDIS